MNFVTIPSMASGRAYEFTGALDLPAILAERREEQQRRDSDRRMKQEEQIFNLPAPGDLYEAYLKTDFHVEWWNWGSLNPGDETWKEGTRKTTTTATTNNSHTAGVGTELDARDLDLSNKKFMGRPNQLLLNGEHSITNLDGWVFKYDCNLEEEDEEGNEMIYLDLEVENGGPDALSRGKTWLIQFVD